MAIKQKRLKEILTSKSFYGSVFFALALWAYTSMNNIYVTTVKVPLNINLPEYRAIENYIQKNITLKVRGTGWHLFYLFFINKEAKCNIDLVSYDLTKDNYTIERAEILKGIQDMINIETIDVIPEKIEINTGLKDEKKIPIIPRINIATRDGFLQVGNIKLRPDSITIKGNLKFIKNIMYWETELIELDDIYHEFSMSVKLKDTLNGRVELAKDFVEFYADVQEMSSITFYDIPIFIKGGSLSEDQQIYPPHLSVTLQGGINDITRISPENVAITINYSKILHDSTGIIIPEVNIPHSIKATTIYPKYVYLVKNKSLTNKNTPKTIF